MKIELVNGNGDVVNSDITLQLRMVIGKNGFPVVQVSNNYSTWCNLVIFDVSSNNKLRTNAFVMNGTPVKDFIELKDGNYITFRE